jgi:hypothetical protein
MSTVLPELEGESLFESESEFEGAHETELEGEHEQEQFFGTLASLAARAASSPTLRRVGLAAARAALGGLGGIGGAIGGVPGSRGAAMGQRIGSDVAGWLSNLVPDSELEAEFEGELENELEVNPIKRWYPDLRESEFEHEHEHEHEHETELEALALMEHLGHAASMAESEAEAEQFLPALIPLALKALPLVGKVAMKAAPHLLRGVSNIARSLFRSPTTRPLIRTIPTIMRRTAAQMARQVGSGAPVTPQLAVRTLARQAAGVLSNPGVCAAAYRRSRALDRRFHVATRSCCRCGR